MFKQTLPCAEKNCKSKMTLIENNDNLLGYSCLEKPDEHNFRYNITQKKWERIIIKTKLEHKELRQISKRGTRRRQRH